MVYGLIKRLNLSLNEEEHIGGHPNGDPDSEGEHASTVLIGLVHGISVDYYGNIYYAESMSAQPSESGGARVRKIDGFTFEVTTIAGTGEDGFDPEIGDTTPFDARLVKLAFPGDASVDSLRINGKLLFIADTGNNRVRAVNISSDYVTFGPENNPITLGPQDMITVVGFDKGVDVPFPSCIHMTTQDGQDGRATGLLKPQALSLSDDMLFIIDLCHRVLIMSLDDLSVTRIAGVVGEGGFNGDGNIGIETKMASPHGILYDHHRKELLIADSVNARVRRLKYVWRIHVSPDGDDELSFEDGAGSVDHPIRTIQRAQTLIDEVENIDEQLLDNDIEIVISPGIYYGHGNLEVGIVDRYTEEIYWTYTRPDHEIRFIAADPENPPVFAGCLPGHPDNPGLICYSRIYEENCKWCDDFEEWCEQHCPDDPQTYYCKRCQDCPCDPDTIKNNLNYCHCWGERGPNERRRIGEWMTVFSTNGENSNISFENIIITGYQGGITFHGASQEGSITTGWNGSNRVVGCKFIDIGDGRVYDFKMPGVVPSQASFGRHGVGLINSRNNVIANNIFRSLENFDNRYPGHQCASGRGTECHIHGVYFEFYSHWNHVVNNVFQRITGNPIKVRDFSNFNYFTNNVFSMSGLDAVYSDHYSVGGDRTECSSYENYFTDNISDGDYRCGRPALVYVKPEPGHLDHCCNTSDNIWRQMPCGSCEDPSSRPSECEGPWRRVHSIDNEYSNYNCGCSGEEIETVEDCRELLSQNP